MCSRVQHLHPLDVGVPMEDNLGFTISILSGLRQLPSDDDQRDPCPLAGVELKRSRCMFHEQRLCLIASHDSEHQHWHCIPAAADLVHTRNWRDKLSMGGK